VLGLTGAPAAGKPRGRGDRQALAPDAVLVTMDGSTSPDERRRLRRIEALRAPRDTVDAAGYGAC